MIKILFVCMGNICRSPTAEGVFRALVKAQGLEKDFYIDSAGTHAYGGLVDQRILETACRYSIDLSGLRSRPVEKNDFKIFDYVRNFTLC